MWVETARHAVRGLLKDRYFTAASLLLLWTTLLVAGSVGGVAIRVIAPRVPVDLPIDRIVELWGTRPSDPSAVSRYLTRGEMDALDELALPELAATAYRAPHAATVRRGAERLDVAVEVVSGDLFGAYGATPLAGAWAGGAAGTAALSARAAQEISGSAHGALGATLTVGAEAFTIVAVAPPTVAEGERLLIGVAGLAAGSRPDAWRGVGILIEPSAFASLRARLASVRWASPGEPAAGAAAGTGATAATHSATAAGDATAPGTTRATGVTAVRLADRLVRRVDTQRLVAAWLMLGSLLILGFVNVGSLALTRAIRRRREVAIVRCLGGTEAVIWVRAVVEAGVLALVALFGALVLLPTTTRIAETIVGLTAPFPQPAFDLRTIGALVATTLTAAVVIVAMQRAALGSNLVSEALRASSTSVTGSARASRLRRLILPVQVAVAVVLCVIGTAVGSAWAEYWYGDVGVHPDLIVGVTDGVLEADVVEGARTAEAVVTRLGGRARATWWRRLYFRSPAELEDAAPDLGRRAAFVAYQIEDGFFETLGIEIAAGRRPGPGSDEAVVTRSAAETWWPGESPLGKIIRFEDAGLTLTVVGISDDFADLHRLGRLWTHAGITRWIAFSSTREIPAATLAEGCMSCGEIVVGARASAARSRALPTALRQAFAAEGVPPARVEVVTLREQQLATYGGPQIRRAAAIVAVLSALAGAVVVVGIVGAVVQDAAHRRKEIGVRAALGASTARLVSAVTRETSTAVAAGLLLGAAFVWAFGPPIWRALVASQVGAVGMGVSAWTMAWGAVALLAVALSTAAIAGLRATRIPPAEALRDT